MVWSVSVAADHARLYGKGRTTRVIYAHSTTLVSSGQPFHISVYGDKVHPRISPHHSRTRPPQVFSMVIIIISFAVGVGNVEGFFISEIMPVYAKDTLAAIGQPLNWIANLIVATSFPILFEVLMMCLATAPYEPVLSSP